MSRTRTVLILLFTAIPYAVMSATPASAAASATATAKPEKCGSTPSFDTEDFPRKPVADNRFLPLVPGTRFILDGTVGGVGNVHRVVTTVTGLTKVIDGVRTIVVLDLDYQDGVLQESEIYFTAQDEARREWLVGEYPEEYDNGKLTGAPDTWIGGVHASKPGITMQADPHVGSRAYLQGVARSVDFEDCAREVETGRRTCVPAGCYTHMLVTDEWAPGDPEGGHQRKFYAPGVGNVRVEPVGGVDPETLTLTSVTKLSSSGLERADRQALEQDRRGYRVSSHVYGTTARIHGDQG